MLPPASISNPGTNRLRNTDGSSNNHYQYDPAGNVIANDERNITQITYDPSSPLRTGHRNLAQQIVTETSGVHRYIYDETGTRIGKQYKPNGATNWSVNTRYVYGAYGELLAQYSGAAPQYWNVLAGGETIGRVHAGKVTMGQNRAYYLKDHLGSVRLTLTEGGTVLGWEDYYPFGLQMSGRSNNTANEHDDMKFTGHFLEQEGGLGIYHARARMYDPETGRFLGVDAMRVLFPSWNSYTYALNNPILLIDTTGNSPEYNIDEECKELGDTCLGSVTITAERYRESEPLPFPELGAPATIDIEGYERVGNVVRVNPNHEGGRQWLYNHFRQSGTACSQVGNTSLGQQAQSIAMTACIHAGQAAFIRASFELGADAASVISLLSGVGTIAGGTAILLRSRSAIQLTSRISTAGLRASGTEAGLRVAAIPAGGSRELAGEAVARAALGFGISRVALPVNPTASHVNPAFRSSSSGQFVSNRLGYSMWGAKTLTGAAVPVVNR